MTKQEFLDRLRMSLNGKILPGQVVENLQYYDDYINTEVRKGATEAEVMARLGDPRLIARTIVETQGGQSAEYEDGGQYGFGRTMNSSQGRSGGERYESGSWYENSEESDGTWYESRKEYQPYNQRGRRHLRLLSRVPVWTWLVLVFLIIGLVVSAVFSLLAAILPILLPVLIVAFLVKAFRDWIN